MVEVSNLVKERSEYLERRDEINSKINQLNIENNSLYLLILESDLEMLEANLTYSNFWIEKLNFLSMIARYNPNFQNKDRLIAMYNSLSEDLKGTIFGNNIYTNLFPLTIVKVGDKIADANMYDPSGNLHHLADYQGKYILLDFWSRGCGPCIAAIPEMREIVKKYKDKLVVVSISSDPKDIWEDASREKNITWPNFNEFKGTNDLFARYGVVGIPNYFLITPDGIINSSWMGYRPGSLLAKMEELIKN